MYVTVITRIMRFLTGQTGATGFTHSKSFFNVEYFSLRTSLPIEASIFRDMMMLVKGLRVSLSLSSDVLFE